MRCKLKGLAIKALAIPLSLILLATEAGALVKSASEATGDARLVIQLGHMLRSVTFSPDGRYVLSGGLEGTLKLWEVATGRELRTFQGHAIGVSSVAFSPDGRYVLSGSFDGTMKVWPIETTRVVDSTPRPDFIPSSESSTQSALCTLVSFSDGTWAVVDADGRFDASDGGHVAGLHWVVDNESIDLSQLKERYYEPGLLSKRLGYNKEPLRDLSALKTVKLFPEVKPEAPTAGSTKLHLQLTFAAKDAGDMAQALTLGAKRLFGAEKVHLTRLSTADHPQAIQPTKANFRQAFAAARRARPEDILVVYLAGHGVALGSGSDTYAYLTQEARSTDGRVLADPAVRAQTTITSEELVEWVKQIPALKQVMILDTCAAGALQGRLTDPRDLSGDQIRAIERLKDRTGFHVLMGSAADAVSYEASRYGQGLLTYAVLQGMRGAALRESEFVDVSRLFQYAADAVPKLAQHLGGIQQPIIAAPRGTSFDIGQLKTEDKTAIPLAMARPLLLRPVFLNPEEVGDRLNLTELVRRRLRDMNDTAARGTSPARTAVYVDADDLPGAIQPKGTYTVDGATVHVKLVLWRDGQPVGRATVKGLKGDAAGLSEKIVAALYRALKPF